MSPAKARGGGTAPSKTNTHPPQPKTGAQNIAGLLVQNLVRNRRVMPGATTRWRHQDVEDERENELFELTREMEAVLNDGFVAAWKADQRRNFYTKGSTHESIFKRGFHHTMMRGAIIYHFTALEREVVFVIKDGVMTVHGDVMYDIFVQRTVSYFTERHPDRYAIQYNPSKIVVTSTRPGTASSRRPWPSTANLGR